MSDVKMQREMLAREMMVRINKRAYSLVRDQADELFKEYQAQMLSDDRVIDNIVAPEDWKPKKDEVQF